MSADGGQAPKPYTKRQASTLFLRVPSDEFRSVIAGRKTEFRALPGKASQLHRAETPIPVVAYMERRGTYDARLMVLEETWQEPVGAISAESLQREGQPDIAHFRRYWMRRTRQKFKPTRMVIVFRVRGWDEYSDREYFANAIFDRLYGTFT